MKINDLKIESAANGTTCVKGWFDCHSADEIDDITAWLQLAKSVMVEWEKIRGRHAKASHSPEAAAGKDENQQPRKV